ncbi:MAG: CHASE2 domain-containing protein [Pseudomonadota bacterium]
MSSVFDPLRIGLILIITILSLLADHAGHFSIWNQRLADARMSLSQRPANGQVVFVAVDAKSVSEVGKWPWSRRVHASLLEVLSQAGARDILFDFDFTFPADPGGDMAFATALEAAGGSTYLAVFEQSATAGDPSIRHYNTPLQAFAQNSWPALVNVQTDASGFVRYYPYGMTANGEFVASAGALIANVFVPDAATFEIDYSIRADSVPVFSAIEVLNGAVSPAMFAGRSIIVGASAVELSDQLAVPVQGIIPGPLVHALAAETLASGRAVRWVHPAWVALVLALALAVFGINRRARYLFCVAGTALTLASVEGAALLLFDTAGIMTPSAILYPGLSAFVIVTLVKSLRTSDWLLLKSSAEARNTFRILDRVFEDSMDGVVILDAQGNILRHSASSKHMFDTNADGTLKLPELLRRAEPLPASAPPKSIEISHASGNKILEYRARLSEVERPTAVGKPPLQDQIKTLVLRDITQVKEQERDIAYLSSYDDRTGALRRNAFLAFLGLRLEVDRDAVIFALTLDRLKTINVTLGRGVGDAILKEVVARLERSPLMLSAPVRLGGTSFAVYTESSANVSMVEQMAELSV